MFNLALYDNFNENLKAIFHHLIFKGQVSNYKEIAITVFLYFKIKRFSAKKSKTIA